MESVSTILFYFIGFTIVYFKIIVTVFSDRVGLGLRFFFLCFLFLFPFPQLVLHFSVPFPRSGLVLCLYYSAMSDCRLLLRFIFVGR